MVFDRTCTGIGWRPGLSHAWASGQLLYWGLGRIDAALGVDTWDDAFAWLATYGGDRPIAEIQYWGHGKWGSARAGTQVFDKDALSPTSRWQPHLERISDRMASGRDGLFWFRTCETFGCVPGQDFAQRLADQLGCRVAGHTFIIGHWQSGLHSLLPGNAPTWSVHEGLREGTPESPNQAFWSRMWKPNTISFLHGTVPEQY